MSWMESMSRIDEMMFHNLISQTFQASHQGWVGTGQCQSVGCLAPTYVCQRHIPPARCALPTQVKPSPGQVRQTLTGDHCPWLGPGGRRWGWIRAQAMRNRCLLIGSWCPGQWLGRGCMGAVSLPWSGPGDSRPDSGSGSLMLAMRFWGLSRRVWEQTVGVHNPTGHLGQHVLACHGRRGSGPVPTLLTPYGMKQSYHPFP